MPSVWKLTEAVQTGHWSRHSDGGFYPIPNPAGFELGDPTGSVQKFLRYLEGLIDAAHAKRGFGPATYEDLFYLTRQIADQERGERCNAAVEPFIDQLAAGGRHFTLNYGPSGGSISTLAALAELSGVLIQSVVRHELQITQRPQGLDLVVALARREPVTIATLNHDGLVERVLGDATIGVADGFGPPDGDVRWFDESLLDFHGLPRLLKLHGSTDWYQFSLNSAKHEQPRVAISRVADVDHCRTANGDALFNYTGNSIFLTGIENKIGSYNLGIYAEMFFRFHEALKGTDTIVMSGYGWADRGVNVRLVDWLLRPAPRRLILLHEKPESLAESQPSLGLRYQSLIDRKRLILVKKWLQNVSLTDLDAILAANPPA